MRRMLVLSIIMLTIFLASGSITQLPNVLKAEISSDTCDPLSADSLSADPISAVGHGTMLNAEGEVINRGHSD